ncbi:MAG: DUF952 domain-containing protein [Hyphomonadaceae bacterium]
MGAPQKAAKDEMMAQTIYKVLTAEQLAAVEAGGLMQAPVDLADGYVHFSTSRQVQETLTKWFHGQTGCALVAVDGDDFGPDLKWEISRGGDWFPHVYTEVREHHVRAIWPLDEFDAAGAPIAPDEVTRAPEPASKPVRPS